MSTVAVDDSNGKRSDKETQSPVLKIFKEIMQRENNDPEKANLLKEQQEDRRRRKYSGSRTKSDQKTCGSSGNEQYKGSSSLQYRALHEPIRPDYEQSKSQSLPFQGGKRESYWFSRDQEKKSVNADTCSCVSCALKRVITSDYMLVGCLLLLFAVSVMVAFVIVFKTVPVLNSAPEFSSGQQKIVRVNVYDDVLKKREKSPGGETARPDSDILGDLAGARDYGEKADWANGVSKHVEDLSGLSVTDLGDVNLRDSNYIEDSIGRLSNELSNVLDIEKLNEGSDRLRSFYKKLIKTDQQIRNLKKKESNEFNVPDMNEISSIVERSKRSPDKPKPKAHPFSFLIENKLINFKSEVKKPKNKTSPEVKPLKTAFSKVRAKRLDNETEEPTGFIIENKKIVVQYNPGEKKRQFPKCSHSTETKSHEKHLKHPFYKNSQKFDELLDQFMNNNLSDVLSDPTSLDLFKGDKDKKCKHPKINSKLNTSSPSYNLMLSISTAMLPLEHTTQSALFVGVPHRKLMQVLDMPDSKDIQELQDLEELYESFSDLDEDKEFNPTYYIRRKIAQTRKKRDESNVKLTSKQSNIGDDYSAVDQNAKGPMPVYSDAVNSMIKQAVIQSVNRVAIPIPKEPNAAKRSDNPNDINYMEDYLSNKYEKMVKMAQAYSDYGVLEGKAKEGKTGESVNVEKKSKKQAGRRVKLSLDDKRDSSESDGEGIRIEFRPYHKTDVTEESKLQKIFGKHIKFSKDDQSPNYVDTIISSSEISTLENDLEFTPNAPFSSGKKLSNKNDGNNLLFKVGKLRSLKSMSDYSLKSEESNLLENKSKSSFGNKKNTTDRFEFNKFFSTLANMFFSLSGSNTKNQSLNDTTSLNSSNSQSSFLTELNTSYPLNRSALFPIYDSDVIENITHRSRALLSLDEKEDNNSYSTLSDNYNLLEAKSNTNNESISTVTNILNNSNFSNTIIETLNQNKNMPRRHVDNDKSKLWNGLYDEEYGVRIDPSDISITDKQDDIKNEELLRSGSWLHNKVRRIANSIFPMSKKNKKRISRSAKFRSVDQKDVFNSDLPKGSTEYGDTGKEDNFAALTANMKKVCQQAARAVHSSRNIKVREDVKDSGQATSLMQQVVGLMADLVDYQVQQRTCMKLPPDLANFLEWLLSSNGESQATPVHFTSHNENSYRADDRYMMNNDDDRVSEHQISVLLTTPPSERDAPHDARSECLGTLFAVQQLMQDYQDMSYEEQNKISGVKEYLENQMNFLQKKLSYIDENHQSFQKRDTMNHNQRLVRFLRQHNRRPKRRSGRFIKRFEKKHTRSTMGDADDIVVMETYSYSNRDVEHDSDIDKKDSVSVLEKRNLRDVYFKAVNDAKKLESLKSTTSLATGVPKSSKATL